MNEYDLETYAHDLYEYHLYEKIRAECPDLRPAQTADEVIRILGLSDTK